MKDAAGVRKTLEYDGSRDLDGFTAFINKHATNKVAVNVDAAGDTDLEL